MMIEREIENIIQMDISHQNQLLRFFSRVDVEIKINVLKKQKEVFFKLKVLFNDEDNAMLTYCSLILAIFRIKENTSATTLNAKIFQVKRFRKTSKREKIIEKWSIVKKLRTDEKFSFRQISQYLQKYHKLYVSYSMIHKIWNQIEIKNTKKGEQEDG